VLVIVVVVSRSPASTFQLASNTPTTAPCNKGTASAGPLTAPKILRALAPEGGLAAVISGSPVTRPESRK
jgi:hypothetical protein